MTVRTVQALVERAASLIRCSHLTHPLSIHASGLGLRCVEQDPPPQSYPCPVEEINGHGYGPVLGLGLGLVVR